MSADRSRAGAGVPPGGSVPPRAGILVTGTEVLTGIITDRNGPWLSERLRELGVDTAMIQIVGDRPEDLLTALRAMSDAGMSLIVTSGGLGPTADDMTAEIVGRFSGREMVLDSDLEARIAEILRPMMTRWPNLSEEAVLAGNRKQAVIPRGATILDPEGTAPGLVVAPGEGNSGSAVSGGSGGSAGRGGSGAGGPTVVVLPGPPRELRPMWATAVRTDAFQRAITGATEYRREIVRLFGIPESEIAGTLRDAADAGLKLEPEMEITTCLRRGEIEIATRFEPDAQTDYDNLLGFISDRHGPALFSRDGATIDEQLAGMLQGQTLAVAESCTGGLLAARLTDRAGSSAYFLGGGVVYSNEAKTDLAGVDPALIERDGAVSVEVAEALAEGIARRFGADFGVGITGVAGPGGGTPDKPVGLVCISVWAGDRLGAPRRLTRRTIMPGTRADIRDRSVTVAMHLLRRLLLGESDAGQERLGEGEVPAGRE
jgi:nicotinamide-nucleotide amidase